MKVAARAGVGRESVRRVWNGEGNITVKNLEQIAAAFGRTASDLLREQTGPAAPAREHVAEYKAMRDFLSEDDLLAAIEMVGDELAEQRKVVSGPELYALIQRAQRYIRHGRELQARCADAAAQTGVGNENADSKTRV
ncbi:MAG TPA: helix-turn-helix transcriptional regulator [Woeseiaceae bacterium]